MTDDHRFRALILGAAAGGGLPQWNCGCANCVAARTVGSGVEPQTQSSLAVSLDGRSWALLNASPDIRQQLGAAAQLHPRCLRDSPLESVLVTNGDIDHIAGLLVLREKQAFTLYATAGLHDIIAANPMFAALDAAFVERRSIALDAPFEMLKGVETRLFAVPGKVPLFMESDDPDVALEGEQTVGVEMKAAGRRIYYIPGCGAVTESLAARLRGADLVLFDGTVFRDDEMIASGTGTKTGRRMGHIAMDGPNGSLAGLKGLGIKRTIYVHINNTNPVWRQSAERARVEAEGMEIGHDGMEVTL
ncbi:pyrroloquinoline quinone biosynthesis protein PqqB [Pararhizobium haloflavum]|uniref:pyrroloquinoline quinone biosynthesis protein PqqB n=1 Tax=Pararhizobium haloflavum TaxID=2037914 RepID=UPI000C1869E5|nr:pyrroloquinoline quinone biosynthesis protein PqqB [Pararhizobium haloflavum]